jgi:hypothetical protein
MRLQAESREQQRSEHLSQLWGPSRKVWVPMTATDVQCAVQAAVHSVQLCNKRLAADRALRDTASNIPVGLLVDN